MKEFLRKTEARKLALFVLFTAGVFFLLSLDARADEQNVTAAAMIEPAER